MGWTEIRITSWEQLQTNLSGVSALSHGFNRPYICRGQADKSWSLKPAILRHFENSNDRHLLLEVEKRLGEEFKARAHLHLSPYLSQLLEDRTDRWALMQHYAAPTRLLDWTTSPYVAAYFACASHPNKDGVLWLVHTETLNSAFQSSEAGKVLQDKILGSAFFDTWDSPRLCTTQSTVRPDRMISQQGVFTICNDILADHADVIDAQIDPKLKPAKHLKLVIGSPFKMEILKHLQVMNISAAALFPGLEGLGQSLQETARLAFAFGV
jgi:FRG domain